MLDQQTKFAGPKAALRRKSEPRGRPIDRQPSFRAGGIDRREGGWYLAAEGPEAVGVEPFDLDDVSSQDRENGLRASAALPCMVAKATR